ncbi:myb-like protein Q isoform X2 [Armigeres subalbatus]|uniref:myb-like protein Q isoform X2 n=1 Tax=Armigeres subalbatus TaxID=124917 RepID=UPI002ED1D73B
MTARHLLIGALIEPDASGWKKTRFLTLSQIIAFIGDAPEPVDHLEEMRRRSRMKVLKILQSFSQGTFIAFILSLLYCGHISIAEPGYLDFDNLPETNFTCAGKVIGGYYADLEASCQMFHVCTIGQGDEPMDIKFLCLNGTVFDQETRVCERVDEVDCSKSERFYYLNLELYGNTIIPSPEESSSEESSSSASSPLSTSTSTTPTTTSTSTTTTKKPLTTTPSRRYIFNNSKGSSIVSSSTLATPTHGYSTTTLKPGEAEEEYEYEDEEYDDTNSKDGSAAAGPNLEDDGGSFSPQQFTLHQQTQNSQPKPEDPAKTGSKPAVSFQQQHFQNGGTLTVTNSHVTVTTHTTSSSSSGGSSSSSNSSNNPTSQKKNAQQFLTQKEKQALEHQKLQQQQALLQQQMLAKQHEELQKKQQEAAVQQQQKAIQQQQKQVQQHESEIKNHQAQLLLHTQKINRQQQKSIPNKSPYNPYGTITVQQQQQQQQHQQQSQEQSSQSQAPKRIPLLAAVNPAGPPQQSPVASQASAVSQLAPFRLRAQGFKLPSQQQEDRFEGYRRQPPPQLRHQKDISLQFDPEEEDLTQIPDRKELKRSDPPFHSSIHGNNTPPPVSLKTSVIASSQAQPTASIDFKQPELDSGSYPDDPVEYYDEDYSAEPASGNPSLDNVKSNSDSDAVVTHKRSGEDQLGDPKILASAGLPTTQASRTSSVSGNNSSKSKNTSRFIINNEHHKSPTSYNGNRGRAGRQYDGRPPAPRVRASYNPQPKVIVTTSTSIRDSNGRTINYSINSSNSSPSTTAASHVASNAKYRELPTRGYDEYKEDDVLTDPFFLDVPKLGGGNGRRKRDASSQRKRRKSFLYIVPRFM